MKKILSILFIALCTCLSIHAQIVDNTNQGKLFVEVCHHSYATMSTYDVIYNNNCAYVLRFTTSTPKKYVIFQLGDSKMNAISAIQQIMIVMDNTKKSDPSFIQDANGNQLAIYKRKGFYFFNQDGIFENRWGFCSNPITKGNLKNSVEEIALFNEIKWK